MNKTQKLELTWVGKGEDTLAVEPRILLENREYGFGQVETGTLANGRPWPGNMLIHGDNLLALRALEQDFAGQIKCIYIDPPYNTGAMFENYDDNLEHSIWINLMYQRLQSLHKLLSDDGVMCMHLDDCEVHYAKVICDEVFGRDNFIATIAIRSSTPSGVKTKNRYKTIIKQKDLMLVYKKSEKLEIYPQYVKRSSYDTHYSYIITNQDGRIQLQNLLTTLIANGILPKGSTLKDLSMSDSKFRQFYLKNKDLICTTQSHKNNEAKAFSLAHPNEVVRFPSKDGKKEDLFYNGRMLTTLSSSIQSVVWNRDITEDIGMLLCDFWDDIDFQNTQNEGGVEFPTSKKPEALIFRVLSLFTKPGDIVLDSFLGSGSTAAVAHKMRRRWIGIELGNHAFTHCFVRLKNVISGSDTSGMTPQLNWRGGGGFKFYELAPSLLNHDKYGNLVINKEYNADMLAAAMAKHQGFTYKPDADMYWKQGHSTEHDFIFTTTQLITVEWLESIHQQMGEDESLLICCSKFQSECRNRFSNITIKKIPKVLLDTCEFDRDDYSLNIISVPEIDDEPEEVIDELPLPTADIQPKSAPRSKSTDMPSLFD